MNELTAGDDRLDALQAVVNAMVHRLGYAVITELKPIIEVIATSLRDEHRFATRDVSVTLPAAEGQKLVVSVRNGSPGGELPHPAPLGGLDARQLQRLNEAIDEKIGEPISVSMLSSIAGLSRSHFTQVFRRTLGRSPHDHIVRLRIERAMKAMLATDAPLSEVALAHGFCDQAHFTNTFRRTVGMTPTKWRRLRRAAIETDG